MRSASLVFNALHALVRSRKKWTNPARARIAILGDPETECALLIPLFNGERYEVVRPSREEFCVTPIVVLLTIWYALKTRSVEAGHAIAVLSRIRPSIVVTLIDNSLVFQRAARHYTSARFLALQNGGRLLERDNPAGSPLIFHSEFACLGRYEVDQYTGHGAIVERFYPVGSLKDSYYRAMCPAPPQEKRFDLCLVSQIKPQHYNAYPKTMASLDSLAGHLRRFCETHGTTLCVAARRHPDRNRELFEWETSWYRERLGPEATIVPNALDEYTSYRVVDASRVSLALHTTLLREGFGRGNRILSCNFTGDPILDFPVPGPWSLTNPAYDAFEAQLLQLLRMSDEEYEAVCGSLPHYLIGYDPQCPTDVFLRGVIADAVRGVPRPTERARMKP